ncbi:caskin-1-like [Sphaerodactylus townsendi]|uniref:caskin-1-like n=1 Tax=Sphaerodactylus townsendi TaxID=933632 RepID=UPI0020272C59|nr:caskin-1-like [Sphaerodactylus townsendi]
MPDLVGTLRPPVPIFPGAMKPAPGRKGGEASPVSFPPPWLPGIGARPARPPPPVPTLHAPRCPLTCRLGRARERQSGLSFSSGRAKEEAAAAGPGRRHSQAPRRPPLCRGAGLQPGDLKMPATDAGGTSGENATGRWPCSPETSQHPSDSSRESLRQ